MSLLKQRSGQLSYHIYIYILYGKLNPALQVLEPCFTSPTLRFSINWYRPSKKYEYRYLFWYRCISNLNETLHLNMTEDIGHCSVFN